MQLAIISAQVRFPADVAAAVQHQLRRQALGGRRYAPSTRLVTYSILGRWICVGAGTSDHHGQTRCCSMATLVAAVRDRTPSLR